MNRAFVFLGSLFCFLLLTNCSQQEDFVVDKASKDVTSLFGVTVVDDNDVEVTTDYLKNKWEEEVFNEIGAKVDFQNFKILKSFEAGNEVYFVKASSKGAMIETGAFLKKISDDVYALGSKECSCKGCPNGCNLEIDGTKCRCTDCSQDTNKECTKTEKAVIKQA